MEYSRNDYATDVQSDDLDFVVTPRINFERNKKMSNTGLINIKNEMSIFSSNVSSELLE